ncbi:MAG: acyltransferase [Pseudomonadota bacterium]
MIGTLIARLNAFRLLCSHKLRGGADGRMQGLDALRGLAALIVVAYHYTCGYPLLVKTPHDALWLTVPLPALGVQIFFVISGFVIFMTLERSRSGMDFFMSRFARLYPPFLFCMLLTATVVFGTGFNPETINGWDVVMNLPLVVGLLSKTYVDPSYWTLTIEVCFYAWIALFYYYVQQRYVASGRDSFERVLGNPLLLALLGWLLLDLAGRTFYEDMYSRMALALNFQYGHLFVAGVAVYGLSRGRLAVPLLILALAVGIGSMPQAGQFSPGGAAKVLCIVGMIWAGSRLRLSGALARWASFLGGISYSLYLLHQILGFAIIHHLETAGLNTNLAMLAALACVIGLAAASRRWIEVPSQRWLLGAYAARKLAAGVAPLRAGPA